MHGKLRSSNVLVDGRWMCKLSDYGLFQFHEGQEQNMEKNDQHHLTSKSILNLSINVLLDFMSCIQRVTNIDWINLDT